MKVAEYLQQQKVRFNVLPHPTTYDAQRMAGSLHVPGREVAKTVLLRSRGGPYVVAVLPATKSIDFKKVSQALGGAPLELATALEIAEHCPDCEFGALPPFGSQYGMKTIVDEGLTSDEEIFFEGNTHQEAIRMRFEDYCRIEKPIVAGFAH